MTVVHVRMGDGDATLVSLRCQMGGLRNGGSVGVDRPRTVPNAACFDCMTGTA